MYASVWLRSSSTLDKIMYDWTIISIGTGLVYTVRGNQSQRDLLLPVLQPSHYIWQLPKLHHHALWFIHCCSSSAGSCLGNHYHQTHLGDSLQTVCIHSVSVLMVSLSHSLNLVSLWTWLHFCLNPKPGSAPHFGLGLWIEIVPFWDFCCLLDLDLDVYSSLLLRPEVPPKSSALTPVSFPLDESFLIRP